ncbi:YgaP family membrane protein [Mycobacterium kansasii]
MTNDQGSAPIERGTLQMPLPQRWTLERTLHLMAGSVVLVTLALGRMHSKRWRILTGFVGANLLFDAAMGWCPTSVLLHRLGVPTAAECAVRRTV